MTKEEKDIIFNQLSELEERHPAFAENVRDNAYCEAIADVKRIIDGIKEPSLPSNLDVAAWKFSMLNPDYQMNRLESFKAGAEWMAGQGETVEGYIAGINEVAAILAIPRKEHNKGDKVVVQIRKK